ncbi:phosphoenolpyruvate--protein phosphotransferase [Luteibacter rhizovicinus]|uniref:Phosphoenolpyruvate-protein phosphotransferase n=1 Tax=Luteibacter rhizovicinus TaxID=242606 RepID=A0A4R3YP73_9GAMM|nr:phosphoenolpyruvate--protein phosphotransferase [Luteibacter rhizovicinus]TCV94072.1 phosphoenolpyruvate--protein phosphotransferase [Luteibacter rhizovicinus]
MRYVLTGTPAARGMALGRARLVQPSIYTVDTRLLENEEIGPEIERLHKAIDTARQELRELRSKLHGALAREVGDFIDAHSLLLDDDELLRGLDELISVGHYTASAALKMQRDRLAAVFDAMNDPYLKSRGEDIDQVIGRVMSVLQQQSSREERKLAARVGEIVVSDTVAPADMASMAGQGMLGVVASAGSVYSHSAILARSFNLPMLVGTRDALATINDDDLVLIDAENGDVIVHPTAQDLARYRQWQRQAAQEGRRLAALASAPTLTRDGAHMRLFANAEIASDVAQARARGADGIGLYRSEFLFLRQRGLPSEDEQFVAYRDLVLGMGGLPVTIRTLDLGADKADAAGLTIRGEENPALGVRGVRLSLRYPDVFSVQLRAILRAACYGPIRILVPMVTHMGEMVAVRALIKKAREALSREGHELPERLDIGAMIEVPAAAIGVTSILQKADFLSIGTNDLAQYVLAADRNNDALEGIYDPLQPAFLRLIAHVIAAARRARKPVSLCGEIAGDTAFTPLLVAMGLEEFSMHPGQLLQVRDKLTVLDCKALRQAAPKLFRAHTRDEVEAHLLTVLAHGVIGECDTDEVGAL